MNDGTANADYVPISLQNIPRVLFPTAADEKNASYSASAIGAGLALDLAVISVSPPCARGYVSLGPSVDVAHSAVAAARKIVAQINSNVPRVFGDGFLHISQIDAIVQVDEKLPEMVQRAGGSSHAAADKIGRMLASTLISDRATLQMGVLCICILSSSIACKIWP